MPKKKVAEQTAVPVEPQVEPSHDAPVLPDWFVFEANRTILHPLGLALVTDGEDGFRLTDAGPLAFYSPSEFAKGRAAYLQMMAKWGYDFHQKRKAALGFVVQEG